MNVKLFEGDWLSVMRTPDGYEYVHQSRMGGTAVAVLAYTGTWVLGRYEVCPPHGEGAPTLCALTGGIDDGETPIQAAARELYEESGFRVPVFRLRELGEPVRPSKASDTRIHLFATSVDLESQDDVKETFYGPGDGSEGEVGAYCRFVQQDAAIMSKDPLLATMSARRRLM